MQDHAPARRRDQASTRSPVGITFAFLPGTRIVPAVALIGTITFAFSAAGIRLGSVVGLRFKRKAEFAGGGILILLGTKILLEHLGIL